MTTKTVSPPHHRAPRATETLDITVLAGGPGVERDVSLESGLMVADALERLGHRVRLRDIGLHDLSALDHPADVVFIALHGAFGEDGTIQRILQHRKIPFCGSGPEASALAMDKVHTKAKAIAAGLSTPRFDLIKPARLQSAFTTCEPPVVVKPRCSGSSVDTFIARTAETARTSIETVVNRYGSALVESYVDGPELTVGILDGQSLPVCEIRTRREFYDYQAKYVDGDTQYLFDVDLPSKLLERVQTESVRLYETLGCCDFARVDWMVHRKTLEPYLIEVNTIPGFTSHSLLPKAAKRAGWSFDALCGRIIDLTLARNTQE